MAFPNAKEQKQAFDRLCETFSPSLAAFCLCAVYNVPFDAEIEAEHWEEYLAGLNQVGHGEGFADGQTDVNAAILGGMDEQERWERVWGFGNEKTPYSENDYRRLDELYKSMTAQLDSVGGLIDKQQEDTARTCARMALQRDKLILSRNKDDVATAKNFDEMIRKNLADCNMRKADILPSQKQRLDGFVDALKKRTDLTPDMTQEDVLQVFYDWLHKKKYPITTDAADHMLLSIQRTMAKNNDMPEPTDLERSMRFDAFASEFAPEPNEQERETYEYLHLLRGEFGDAEGDD